MSNPYIEDARKILELYKIRRDDGNWTTVLEKEGTTLQSQNYPECSIPAYMVKTTIHKSKSELLKKLWDIDEAGAKKNDSKIQSWRIVGCKGDDWKVIEQITNMMFPIWSRQLIFAQVKINSIEENTTYLVGFSVNHPDAHIDKNSVLAHLHMSVYEYSSNSDGSTTITRITQIDPKGTIPVSLITAFSGNLVTMFNNWKNE